MRVVWRVVLHVCIYLAPSQPMNEVLWSAGICDETDRDESSRDFVVGKTHLVLWHSGDIESKNLEFFTRTLESSMKFVHASTFARLAVVIVLGTGLEKVSARALQGTSSVRFLNIYFLLFTILHNKWMQSYHDRYR